MTIESTSSGEFKLRSPSLDAGAMVPADYLFSGMGCHGQNLSPALEWEGAPEETRSFALTVMDPDSHNNGGWRHWTLVNIPKDVNSLEEGASSKGRIPKEAIEVENDFGDAHYGGPCPPRGDKPHRYVFTLYALKTDKLNVNEESDRTTVETSLESNSLGKTSFTVRYGR